MFGGFCVTNGGTFCTARYSWSWEQLEAHMRASIKCPSTGEVVSIEVPTDAQTVASSWKKYIRFQCPHCSDRHAIPFREVYIDGVFTSLYEEPSMLQMMVQARRTPAMKQEEA
jgi:phage FluMu protein Com